MIDKKIIEQHNLTLEEYQKIVDFLGREPNLTELGIFSLMWSEHCSYKSSKIYLKNLPTTGKQVIQGPGENAGVIDIGDGLAAVFKIESHNHPSYIEPYQGAATGVGGILRDIFTMGARPIAVLDSLHFGPLNNSKNRVIMEGVVSGIAGYGNSFGVPTVGGEAYFNQCYSQNPLVNVLCVGIAPKDKIFYARAEGKGNPVLYVGAKTGRDGIHGATMASAEFGEDIEKKRPNVQVGDPFKEKLLLEACLEVMSKDLIVGIQDMGAAGLTCSTSEMADKSHSGIEIDLDLVPKREEGMNSYEIMLSESQERMLLVTRRENEAKVKEIFKKWDLDAITVGRVTDTGRMVVKEKGKIVVDIPVSAIVKDCPVYQRPVKEPSYLKEVNTLEFIPIPKDLNETFLKLLASPTIADKEWIYRQYDHMVQINTALLPGGDASVLRIKGTKKALGIALDGNSLYTYLAPKRGAQIAVAEACRNLACVGAKPLGVTNCLNFGNPEKPEIMWQFKEVVEGMAEACRFFNLPVTGGNVSFYNETMGVPVYPTPVLGIVGLIDDISKIMTPDFKNEGDYIILLGKNKEELGGSEYLKTIFNQEKGLPPEINLSQEKKIQDFCLELINKGLINSAHDISEGGLAVCVAESCFMSENKWGVEVNLEDDFRPDALLFGETQSRIVVSTNSSKIDEIKKLARSHQIPYQIIGQVKGEKFQIRQKGKLLINLPLKKIYHTWKETLPDFFKLTLS
ncbi:MAG: phosphoribosylformylglycinamidine synthase subunit PurL [Candidatus Aminicenantia bacterium]